MQTLNVALAERSYPIHIGENLLKQFDGLGDYIHGHQVMVVSNETVAPLYLEQLSQHLKDYQQANVILPDGEQYKNLTVLNTIFTALLENKFDRQCTLIALGGGVVGDMTGFAAASYQRGVNFIQIPTTLLSQVDSSVGGKTGVNHNLGKNMIGAFHQPQAVITDVRTLATLADRELSAGIAEIIKIALIGDSEFFVWLETNMPALLARDYTVLSDAILRACQLKADIVAADEKEKGQRALLNLGHTFGHAIEAGLGYGQWLHGEAVAAGMVAAALLSVKLGYINTSVLQRIKHLIQQANLPIAGPAALTADALMSYMQVDKKVVAEQLRLILLQDIGKAVISTDFTLADVNTVLAAWVGDNTISESD